MPIFKFVCKKIHILDDVKRRALVAAHAPETATGNRRQAIQSALERRAQLARQVADLPKSRSKKREISRRVPLSATRALFSRETATSCLIFAKIQKHANLSLSSVTELCATGLS